MNVKIILVTSSDNPWADGGGYYAVVELKPALVDQIHRRVEMARKAGQQDNDLWELYFWGGTAEFYDSDLIDACQDVVAADRGEEGDQAAEEWLAGLERDDYAPMPATVDLAAHQPQRVECAQIIVRARPSSVDPEFEIAWTVILKHTDTYITTRDLPLAALENYVGGQPNQQ